LSIVLVGEGDLAVGKTNQPVIGQGDSMGIAGQILEHLLGPSERGLAVDPPGLPVPAEWKYGAGRRSLRRCSSQRSFSSLCHFGGRRLSVGVVTGTVDLLYHDPETDRLVVADYKTDDLDRGEAETRSEAYAPQGAVYARALQEALDLEEEPRFELGFCGPNGWSEGAEITAIPTRGAPEELTAGHHRLTTAQRSRRRATTDRRRLRGVDDTLSPTDHGSEELTTSRHQPTTPQRSC